MLVNVSYFVGGLLVMALTGLIGYIGVRLDRWRQGAAGTVGTLLVLLWLAASLVTGLAGLSSPRPDRECAGAPIESC
jgi:hypothetical protein